METTYNVLQNTVNNKYSIYRKTPIGMKKFAECENKKEADVFLENYIKQVKQGNVLSSSYPAQSICVQCNQSGHAMCNKD